MDPLLLTIFKSALTDSSRPLFWSTCLFQVPSGQSAGWLSIALALTEGKVQAPTSVSRRTAPYLHKANHAAIYIDSQSTQGRRTCSSLELRGLRLSTLMVQWLLLKKQFKLASPVWHYLGSMRVNCVAINWLTCLRHLVNRYVHKWSWLSWRICRCCDSFNMFLWKRWVVRFFLLNNKFVFKCWCDARNWDTLFLFSKEDLSSGKIV